MNIMRIAVIGPMRHFRNFAAPMQPTSRDRARGRVTSGNLEFYHVSSPQHVLGIEFHGLVYLVEWQTTEIGNMYGKEYLDKVCCMALV